MIPDGTRSSPLPLLLHAVHEALVGRVTRLTALVALGTHAAMTEAQLAAHLGYGEGGLAATYPGHDGAQPRVVGPGHLRLGGQDQRRPGGRAVRGPAGGRRPTCALNRAVVEHDVALVVGPVFPHEVVGFSGGNKYFFPGIAGQEIIDLTHWVGALITSAEIIGTRGITPVRALINEAASLIPSRAAGPVRGRRSPARTTCTPPTFGTPEEAWAAAAEVSAETHVRYLDAPVKRVRLDHPDEVRGHLDRGQGLLQARAGGRRRRRGDPVRAARARRSPSPTRRSTRSATTAATTS